MTQIRQSGTSVNPSPFLESVTCAGSNDAFLASREKSLQMSKFYTLFIATIASSIAGVCIVTSSNAQSPMGDADYCQALVKAWDVGGPQRGRVETDLDASVAIAQCREGNPKPAIPVLQQKLRDNRIPVPPRT
jgi:hypothetical protein